jgi:transaldolase
VAANELETRIEALVADIAHRGVCLPSEPPMVRPEHPMWTAFTRLGTELWLDTGDMDDAERLWSAEFSALTTNNTLLSKEVGKGIYDGLIKSAAAELRALGDGVDNELIVREVGLVLNAHHGLRLVEKFGAQVSVELHTGLADDLDGSLAAGRRLFAMCPSHFIVKVPLTPTGILVARRLVLESIPVNFTLEFSARQNYVVARLANPDYVNVFLGRLNAFVGDHGLGDGRMVGEKATLASQRELLALRSQGGRTRQIAASLREPGQLVSLAGVDVFTMPIPVAEGMVALTHSPDELRVQVNKDPSISITPETEPAVLEALWSVPEELRASVGALVREDLDTFSGEDLADFFRVRGHGDIFPKWTTADLDHIAADGKIPSYERWRNAFESFEVGLDAALNVAGMASFALDQATLDDRIRTFL